jgi:hypothetical protein
MSEKIKWGREADIFARFLEGSPRFAGAEIVHWEHNQNDSPDILCTDLLGHRISV